MTFCYYRARVPTAPRRTEAWDRVKGATESALVKLPFKKVYMFRRPTPRLKNVNKQYSYIAWLYHISRALYPAKFSTLQGLGLAMIKSVNESYEKPVLEVKGFVKLAKA